MKVVLGLFSLLILTACSTASNTPQKPAAQTKQSSQQNPFEIKVTDEVNDGKRIHIVAEVRSQVAWPLNDIVLKVASFSGGEIKETQHFRLDQYRSATSTEPPQVTPETPLPVAFSINAPQVTDYQLSLLWGKEARGIPQVETKVAVAIKKIEQRRVCTEAGCTTSFIVLCELVNTGTTVVPEVTLGVGVALKESLAAPPQKEEQLEIERELLPGARQQVRVVLDSEISDAESEKYQPVVRIISVG